MNLDAIVEAVARSHLERCLRCAANLGPSRADMFAPQTAKAGGSETTGAKREHEAAERISRTCTPSYLLGKCRDVAHAFLQGSIAAAGRRRQSGAAHDIAHSAADIAATGAPGLYGAKVARVADDVSLPPLEKLAIARDDLGRLLSGGDGGICWDAVLPVTVLIASLVRMAHGDWSLEVARAEFDLALVYISIGCVDAAADHVESCRVVLAEVRGAKGALPAEVELLSAACYLLRDKPDAGKALRRADRALEKVRRGKSSGSDGSTEHLAAREEAVNADDDDASLFAYHYVGACAALDDGADHHEALRRMERAIACACNERQTLFVNMAQMSVHFRLLARADSELGAAPIAAARERLLEEIREAKTQADLDDINAKLKNDVAALEDKRRSHEALCVRQVDRIVAGLQATLRRLCDHSDNKQRSVERVVAILSYSAARACWAVARLGEAAQLMEFAAAGVAAIAGSDAAVSGLLLLDRGMLLIGEGVHRSEVAPVEQRRLCDAALTHATSDSNASALRISWHPLRRFCGVDGGQRHGGESRSASSSDSDDGEPSPPRQIQARSDSHTSHRDLERGLRDAEAALTILQAHRGWYSATIAGALVTLEAGYHAAHRSKDELTIAALLCDITATVMGPTHHRTVKLLKEYGEKVQRVHPPLISPNWGVHPILTRVTIACNTPGATVHFTLDGEPPSEDVGVNGTVKYAGPIVLDRLGRITLRAFAFKDGKRSGEVVARYSVVKK